MVDVGSRHGRSNGAQTTLQRMLAGAIGLGAAGCGESAAEVVVVWVDAAADDDGNRRVRIYDAGEREQASIIPDIPGSGIDLLQVGVDGRARGVALSATDETVWFQRDSGRRVTMTAAAVGREEFVAPGFSFTRSGDAMLRALEVDPAMPPAWLLAPLSGPSPRVHLLSAPDRVPLGRRWVLAHAADAPLLVMAEARQEGSGADGQVLAVAYPSDEGQGPVVDDLRALGRGLVYGDGGNDDDESGSASSFLGGCPEGLCMSPSGRALWTVAAYRDCELERWSWVDAASAEADTPPLTLAIGCPGGTPTRLVAALDDDLVVLDDRLRLYLVDASELVAAAREQQANGGATGEGGEAEPVEPLEPLEPSVSSLPKPSGISVPYLAAQGRVLVVSSQKGEVARVDAEGLRMVSGVQSTCVLRDGLAVSPGGAWVVQSCNGQNGAPSGLDGTIQRISVLGSELYTGTPMRPIAVDDEGNALLYSIASDDDDGVPRGLFVLSGDGKLTRVDELEPPPGRVLLTGSDGEASPGRFAASGPG